jgi:ABC-type branched-subunit amino acid transport system ATPase component
LLRPRKSRKKFNVIDSRAPVTIRLCQGVTVLLSEQAVNHALSGADRGYVLQTGGIVRSRLATDLISDP